MGKKSKRNRSKTSTSEESRLTPVDRHDEEETKDNLRFEDPFYEEYIVEDDEDAAGNGDGNEDGNDADIEVIQSWNPLTGQPLEPGQKLEIDPSAYKMHHALTPEWPCLSFDFVRDDLGESRTRFPHSLTAIVGTQAERPDQNQITLLKMSDLAKMQVETEDDILGEEYNPNKNNEDSDDEDESEEEIDLDPVVEHYSIPHSGGVNRVRCMPQQPNIVATWSDLGKVHLFNTEKILNRFATSEGKPSPSSSGTANTADKPFFTYSQHPTEGFAMDWSRIQRGALATGDCAGGIHIWSPRPEGGYSVSKFFERGEDSHHSMGVEDIQWSPSEATVFATAEGQGCVRIFDTRAPQRAMISHKIHDTDVNVLSWNHLVKNLLATGSDDGVLSVWDLRQFSTSSSSLKPLARFTPHRTPITSVEWHPTDESMLAVSDDNGAYVYDLSVEEDDTVMSAQQREGDIPPQLLFVHSGSEQFKELHWHPQISSCIMTTALTGFSVFIPSNL